ncbi:MAG TPA: sporulation-delaying protein SdpB family protein [Candidatus Limnocylindrales bacterium]|nr:sporulation-delaying protein SdpB family protein [Candidatus Limnocylindrales bacterium]
MLSEPLARLGLWARPHLATPVWSSGLGLARSLIALGTLGTLATSPATALMSPLANGVVPPICRGPGAAGIWCIAPDNLAAGRWLSIAILLVVASGWRPRFTAIPHWYVSWSLIANATLQDGGDQITAILTLLLIPICVTDSRRWHWQAPVMSNTDPGTGHVVARVTLLLIQVQMAVLYLQASVAKLGVPEWADGTAMYYWSHHPTFGSAPWLRPFTDLITYSPVGVAVMTWGSIALEFSLAVAILLAPPARRILLVAGLVFHTLIALDMGLVSFGFAMCGGLLLYLLPAGHQLAWPHRLWRRVATG